MIPGVQAGDRTLEEQMLGVLPALDEAEGKTVLDLGCAEGLIGREFARSGARSVHGIDSVEGHVKVAWRECAGLPMTFEVADFNILAKTEPKICYDIVLSLGVCHKLHEPGDGIRYSARSARELCLIRMCASGEAKDGILRSKHRRDNSCDVFAIMQAEGFVLQKIVHGPREETVLYYRREA